MSIDRDEWLAALGNAAIPTDEDALTIHEVARAFGIAHHTAYRRVRDLLAQGRAVQVFKTIARVDGYARRVPAYRLAPTTIAKKPLARKAK